MSERWVRTAFDPRPAFEGPARREVVVIKFKANGRGNRFGYSESYLSDVRRRGGGTGDPVRERGQGGRVRARAGLADRWAGLATPCGGPVSDSAQVADPLLMLWRDLDSSIMMMYNTTGGFGMRCAECRAERADLNTDGLCTDCWNRKVAEPNPREAARRGPKGRVFKRLLKKMGER